MLQLVITPDEQWFEFDALYVLSQSALYQTRPLPPAWFDKRTADLHLCELRARG